MSQIKLRLYRSAKMSFVYIEKKNCRNPYYNPKNRKQTEMEINNVKNRNQIWIFKINQENSWNLTSKNKKKQKLIITKKEEKIQLLQLEIQKFKIVPKVIA